METIKLPIIGTGAVLLTVGLVILTARLIKSRSNSGTPVNINVNNVNNTTNSNSSNSNNKGPTCPETPQEPARPIPIQEAQAQYNMAELQQIDIDVMLKKEAHE